MGRRSELQTGDAKEAAVRKLVGVALIEWIGGSLRIPPHQGEELRKRTCLAAGGGLLAAAIGIFGAPAGQRQHAPARRRRWSATPTSTATPPPPTPSTGTPGTRTARSPRCPAPRSRPGARAWARAWPPRARSRQPRTAGTCWRWTPAATRSRSCASPRAACRCSSASRCPRTGSGRSASRSPRPAWSTWRTPAPAAATTPASGSASTAALTPVPGSTYAVPDDSGLGDVFFNALGDHLIGTRTGTSLIDSFLVLPGGRLIARQGLSLHRAGPGPARRGVLAGQPLAAVRQQRPQRRRPRHGVRVQRQPARQPLPDRVLALRRRADRALLGGDQPQRQVPVHRQHRLGQHLQLRHQPERLTHPDRQHAHRGGGADIDARLSPDGKYLLVDGSGKHFVSVFAVNGGSLTEVPSSPTPLPAGVTSPPGSSTPSKRLDVPGPPERRARDIPIRPASWEKEGRQLRSRFSRVLAG